MPYSPGATPPFFFHEPAETGTKTESTNYAAIPSMQKAGLVIFPQILFDAGHSQKNNAVILKGDCTARFPPESLRNRASSCIGRHSKHA